MTDLDLAAIRARDAKMDYWQVTGGSAVCTDRRVLLEFVDALAVAARKAIDGLATERGCGECWPAHGVCGSACRMTDCAAVQTLLDEVNP